MKTSHYFCLSTLAAAVALTCACDTKVNVPPTEKKVEKNTTVVNPPPEKKVENTTIIKEKEEKKP